VDDNAELSELAQDVSQVEARLEHGERIAVTNNGKLLGYLVPADQPSSPFERLVAAGQVRRATGSLLDLMPPPPAEPGERPLSEVVLEMRDEERY
jgi:antitoxin (DNA-binding transcriptional repressor) of toxin-antitoxin stability system